MAIDFDKIIDYLSNGFMEKEVEITWGDSIAHGYSTASGYKCKAVMTELPKFEVKEGKEIAGIVRYCDSGRIEQWFAE